MRMPNRGRTNAHCPPGVLGSCNPAPGFEAPQLEDKVGTMLPRNVVVQEAAADKAEVAARVQVMLRNLVENL